MDFFMIQPVIEYLFKKGNLRLQIKYIYIYIYIYILAIAHVTVAVILVTINLQFVCFNLHANFAKRVM